MSESAPSLSTRAQRLTALARAKRENQRESQEQGQFQTALKKLDEELQGLRVVLGVHRKLKSAGVPVPSTQDLADAPQKLESRIRTVGRPSPQFLTARSREVASARVEIEQINFDSWRTWASQRVAELPRELLPRVPSLSRDQMTIRLSNLDRWASTRPSISDVSQFLLSYDSAKAEFDAIEAATIDDVLKRFANGRIRLADLTDPELGMLREDTSLSDQLYLQLKP